MAGIELPTAAQLCIVEYDQKSDCDKSLNLLDWHIHGASVMNKCIKGELPSLIAIYEIYQLASVNTMDSHTHILRHQEQTREFRRLFMKLNQINFTQDYLCWFTI